MNMSFLLYSYIFFQFLGNVSSSQILAVLLKHLHQLAMFVPYFTRLRRPLLKRLVTLWGSGEETVRVVSFLCLLKITTNQQQALLEQVLKVWQSFTFWAELFICEHYFQWLGTFTNKSCKSASVSFMFASLSACNNSRTTEWIFVKSEFY